MSLTKTVARPILATVAGFIVLMGVEIPWHDTLFGSYYETVPYIVREDPAFGAPTIGGLIRALLMSVLYPLFIRAGSVLVQGLLFGTVIGFLTGIYWIPSYYAQQPIPAALPWFLVEGAFFLIQGAAAGLVIALVYGKQRTA